MILSHYDNKKSGNTLLFIHGTASANDIWEEQYKILEELNYRIIGVDLRGHGKSINPGGICTTDHHLDDIKETLDHISISGQVIVIGHSFGAVVALKLAEKHPELVSRLLLISLPPSVPQLLHRYYKWLLGKPVDLLKKTERVVLKLPVKKRLKLAVSSDMDVVRAIWKDSLSWDFINNTPKVSCPVFFSVGRFDYVALESSINRLYKKFPNSSCEVFNFASHACMDDQPKEFNKWVMKSLS